VRRDAMRRTSRRFLPSALLVFLLFAGRSGAAADKVNVNTAAEADLMKLPEMTEARAKAIIGYRKSTGELIQVEELQLIPQVKPIYEKLKGSVTVE
jgi:competence protein ComEA